MGFQHDPDDGDPVLAALQRRVAREARHAELPDERRVLLGVLLRAPRGDLRHAAALVQGRGLHDPELVDAEAQHAAGHDGRAGHGVQRLAVHGRGAADVEALALHVDAQAPAGLLVVDARLPRLLVQAEPGLDHRVLAGDVAVAWRLQDEVEPRVQHVPAPAHDGVGHEPVHAARVQAPELEGDRMSVRRAQDLRGVLLGPVVPVGGALRHGGDELALGHELALRVAGLRHEALVEAAPRLALGGIRAGLAARGLARGLEGRGLGPPRIR
mmetsp:Transcript_57630/g.185126  ORF Transcript_57630/g.185126 Transcript_57630/m.185126 type:complete len:270 (-) Transcript_57630:922-1731(-)